MSYNELAKEINHLQNQNEMLENELHKIQKVEPFLHEDLSSEDHNTHSFEQKKADAQFKYNQRNNSFDFNENEDSDSSRYQSFIDLNSDMSTKLSKMQKQLRTLQKENAELKKSISIVEAENAKLITENQELKWKVDSLSSDSSIKLQEKDSMIMERDSQLDIMKNELKKAKTDAEQVSQMMKENSLYKQEVINFHQQLSKHKEELKRAKKEIKRLSEKNNQSDDQIAEMEQLLKINKNNLLLHQQNQEMIENYQKKLHQKRGEVENNSMSLLSGSYISSNDQNSSNQIEYLNCQKKLIRDLRELKAFCISLRDENKSLHHENQYLKEKLRNRSPKRSSSPANVSNKQYQQHRSPSPKHIIYPQNRFTNDDNSYSPNKHIQQNRRTPPMSYTNDVVKAIVSRCMNTFLLKMELLNTKILTSIDHLSLVINHFQGTYKQNLAYQKSLSNLRTLNDINSSEQFLANLRREIRIIQSLSQCYAKSHNIPKSNIPKPDQLIGNHIALLNFLDPDYQSNHEF